MLQFDKDGRITNGCKLPIIKESSLKVLNTPQAELAEF